MIGLARGQRVIDKFKAESKMGTGILYLLDTGISLEVSGKGLALELGYDEISSAVNVKKEALLLSWQEGNGSFQFRIVSKNAAVVQKIIRYQKSRALGFVKLSP